MLMSHENICALKNDKIKKISVYGVVAENITALGIPVLYLTIFEQMMKAL